MAAKIIFLFILLALPSFTSAQKNEEIFSIKLKLDKTNYSFSEYIKPVVTIKNISGKKDSLPHNGYPLINLTNQSNLFYNNGNPYCSGLQSDYLKNSYKTFDPDEEFSQELNLTSSCSNLLLDKFLSAGVLDTGFYNFFASLSMERNRYGKKIRYETISNEISFIVNPPDSSEKAALLKLQNILDYTVVQLRDSVYMLSVLQSLDDFTRKNITMNLSDIAFYKISTQINFQTSFKNKFLQLSKFYLTNKPNGSHVYFALWPIYYEGFEKDKSKEKGIEELEEYIKKYPNTKIEIEAEKIIKYKKQQKKEN